MVKHSMQSTSQCRCRDKRPPLLREKLWEPQEEEGRFVTKCIKALRTATRPQENDVHAAWTSINSAYGSISRISVKIQDVNDEMNTLRGLPCERHDLWDAYRFIIASLRFP